MVKVIIKTTSVKPLYVEEYSSKYSEREYNKLTSNINKAKLFDVNELDIDLIEISPGDFDIKCFGLICETIFVNNEEN